MASIKVFRAPGGMIKYVTFHGAQALLKVGETYPVPSSVKYSASSRKETDCGSYRHNSNARCKKDH